MEYAPFNTDDSPDGMSSFNIGENGICPACNIENLKSKKKELEDTAKILRNGIAGTEALIQDLRKDLHDLAVIRDDLLTQNGELRKKSQINIKTITDVDVDKECDCSICMEHEYISKELTTKNFIKTSCGHVFHAVCFIIWVADHNHENVCPMCRQKNIIQANN